VLRVTTEGFREKIQDINGKIFIKVKIFGYKYKWKVLDIEIFNFNNNNLLPIVE